MIQMNLSKIRFPFLYSIRWSDEGLWTLPESNGEVIHHVISHVHVMTRYGVPALELIILKLAVAIAWIGWRKNV
jgi:hypothetical protein